MKEEIEKVLNDETLTTNEEKVEAINKALGTIVVPKSTFNDINNKLKNAESNYSTLSDEFNQFKQSKMTADEKIEAERKQFEADKKANAITRSELAVEKLFLQNGIEIKDEDVELKETLSNIVSEDYDKTVKLANSFISILNKTKENTKKETTTDLLNGTPKPEYGNPNAGKVSNLESLKAKYADAVKNGNTIDMITYQRLIFEEQSKKNI